MPDFLETHPGYHGGSRPNTYTPTHLRVWTGDAFTTVKFGGMIRRKPVNAAAPRVDEWPCSSAGLCVDQFNNVFKHSTTDLMSAHPMRARDWTGAVEQIEGTVYSTGFHPPLYMFRSGEEYPQTHTWHDLPVAGTPVTLTVVADSMNLDGGRVLNVFFDGQFVGEMFRTAGDDGHSVDHLEIDLAEFELYRSDDDAIAISYVPVGVSPSEGRRDTVQARLVYTDEGREYHTFANREVCFQHRALGVIMRPDGKCQPVVITQSNRNDDPKLAYGSVIVQRQGRDWPIFGRADQCVAAVVCETPRSITGIFGPYAQLCGVEV